ncbi:PAS domain S-box protein [Pseudodesulfovibrio sp.]|nr:PAS domain S-box protein [Pseudodesulfovibrio sp.]
MASDKNKTKTELIEELEALRACVQGNASVQPQSPSIREGKYKQVVDELPQMVYEFDHTGRLVYANAIALGIFGYSREDIANGLVLNQLIHPDDLERTVTNMGKAMQGEGSKGKEYRAKRKDGSFFPIKIYSQGVFEDGRPVGVRGTIVDISDVKQAEEKLKKSETYYRTLFENTGTAMCTFGNDAVIRSCNSQFEALSGYSTEEIIDRMKWSDMVDPAELKRISEYHAKREQEEHDAPSNYEFTFLAKEGVYKEVAIFIQVIPGTEDRVCSLIDITASKQAEEKLRSSEERYGLVVRGANDGIWDWDLDSDTVYYSPRYKAILGYEDHEFPNVAASWLDSVHPDDLNSTIAANTECIEGRVDQFEIEYRMRHKDGSYRWVLGRGASVKNEHGKVYRMAGTHTDVTARRKAEERFREIIENASDGIYQATPAGNFITVNSAMARHLGYESPNEMLSAVNDIGPQLWVKPEARAVFLKDLSDKGKLDNYEVQLSRKDGRQIWVSENIRAIYDDDGKMAQYEGFLQDITARKLHERTTNALYAISKAISTTRNLRHLYEHIHAILNEVIDARNFFIALYDEEKDRVFFPYFEDERDTYYDIRNVSDPETKSLTVHILRTGKPLFISQGNTQDKQVQESIGVVGTPAAVWLGVPLKLKGTIIGAMAVQHYSNPHHYTDTDVTLLEAVSEQVAMAIERKANEEELTSLNEELESKVETRTAELQEKASELQAANKRLTELDEIKSTLVSSVSHELRTPLTSIRGFAKLTGKDFLRHFHPLADRPTLEEKGERIRKNLEIIESEGERLTRLINDFLDINRIESGKAVWNDAFLNPCEVIRQAVTALSGAFAAKPDVQLSADLPKSIPPIHADPDKVQQVLINLLNNACKFTSEGSVTVSVVTNPDTLTISVADTGMGIPKEEQAQIFEKFHKSRKGDTISIKDKGTGLGLAICREIVEHYDGTIWVVSEPDKGSTFSFTLPTISGTETACT